MMAGFNPEKTQDLDIKHPVQQHVGLVFQMKWRRGGQYSSDADTVTACEPTWIHPAGSFEAFSLGFMALKQREMWSVVWDGIKLNGSSLKPHKHKLAENKVTTENQLHSSVEPKQMENYTFVNASENSSDSRKSHCKALALQCFSSTLVCYLGSQWRLK